jgi:hypothetical protein
MCGHVEWFIYLQYATDKITVLRKPKAALQIVTFFYFENGWFQELEKILAVACVQKLSQYDQEVSQDVAGTFKRGNELSGSINCGKFLG